MKKRIFNGGRSAEARPIFRIIAGCLALLIFGMGALAIADLVFDGPLTFDSRAKFGIAASIVGVFLFILCVQGRILK